MIRASAFAALLPAGACGSFQDGVRVPLPAVERGVETEVAAFVDAESTYTRKGRAGPALRYEAGVALDIDAADLVADGWGLVLDVRSIRGEPVGVESLGGASSLENPDVDAIADAFLRWQLAGERLAVRGGLLDGNRRFGAIEAVGGFFNAAAITPPTIVGLPAAPVSAPGVEVEGRWEGGDLAVGVFDGDRAGAGSVAANGVAADELQPELGRFAVAQAGFEVGAVRSTAGVHWNDADGGPVRGAYGVVEGEVWPGATAFAMVARNGGNGGDDLVRQHAMAGLSLEGLFASRTGPRLVADGFGVLWSQTRAAVLGAGHEDAWEMFYRLGVDELSVAVSAQYLLGSDAAGSRDDVVVGLRVSSSF